MDNNRNMVLAIGAGVAVLAGIILAVFMFGRGKAPETPPADKGSLSVDVAEAPTLDPTRKLRCYVNGQFVGETSLRECAQKNGVSTESLDVGLDESGALVAAETASLAPPPVLPSENLAPVEDEREDAGPTPDERQGPQPADDDFTVAPRSSGGAQCLRHVDGDWRQLSADISLEACVSLLFDGRCVRPGGAEYGRWGDVTLRLVPRRVEQSTNNRNFTTLERRPSC